MSYYDDYEPDGEPDYDGEAAYENHLEDLAEIHFIDKDFFKRYESLEGIYEERMLTIFRYIYQSDWLPTDNQALKQDLSKRAHEYLSGRILNIFIKDISSSFNEKKSIYFSKIKNIEKEEEWLELEKIKQATIKKRENAIGNAKNISDEVHVVKMMSINKRGTSSSYPYLDMGIELNLVDSKAEIYVEYNRHRLGTLPQDISNKLLAQDGKKYVVILLKADFKENTYWKPRLVSDWEIGEEPRPPIKVTESILEMELLIFKVKSSQDTKSLIADIMKKYNQEKETTKKSPFVINIRHYIGRKAMVKYYGMKKSKWVGKTVTVIGSDPKFDYIFIVSEDGNQNNTNSFNKNNLEFLD
ncbi:hypothetical protein [Bacillus cereus]|uniref:hypothetical protein n=1 Tax=Bacillus cereus TaxID=1396 RepID=UPI00077A0699|nr:hypothetical protein [Bacillus cereus]KXY54147.1 hypothetical protein AT275_02720 [Bacillus cereus]